VLPALMRMTPPPDRKQGQAAARQPDMACQDVWPPRVPENRGWVTRRHDGGFSRRDGRADRPTQTAANPTGRLLDLTCVYEPHRSAEALEALLGQAPIPVGEVYLPRDPPRMFKAVRQTSKPCLAFKILAAGRLSERRQWRGSGGFQPPSLAMAAGSHHCV